MDECWKELIWNSSREDWTGEDIIDADPHHLSCGEYDPVLGRFTSPFFEAGSSEEHEGIWEFDELCRLALVDSYHEFDSTWEDYPYHPTDYARWLSKVYSILMPGFELLTPWKPDFHNESFFSKFQDKKPPYEPISFASLPGNIFQASALCIELIATHKSFPKKQQSRIRNETVSDSETSEEDDEIVTNNARREVTSGKLETPKKNPKVFNALGFIKDKGPIKGLLIARHIMVKMSTFRSHYVPKLKELGVISTDDGYVYQRSDSQHSAT